MSTEITEIERIEIVSEFRHLQVKFQEFLIRGPKKDAVGPPNREVIDCGNTTRLTELGIDWFDTSKLWPQTLIDQWEASQEE